MSAPRGFEAYARRTLAQAKPHHVVGNVVDWLLWWSDGWEEVSDCTGSASCERTFRRISDGQHVDVSVVWREAAEGV